ncbi:MAG: TIGR01459 family HAD-type hydrolase [Bosea sp. (in: a-proteobacteria)]
MAGVPVLPSAASLFARYDTIISDVWGVVHDGVRGLVPACAALSAFRADGGTVVLLSNAPGPCDQIAELLDSMHVPRAAWDRLVTSGDVTRERVRKSGYKCIYHIGTDRDREVFDGLDVKLVDEDDAQMVVATELRDDRRETPEHYRPLLTRLEARGLPMVCGNPDLVVHIGHDLLPCAGALATIYEELGGDVHWAGKPHRPAYDMALAQALEARGGCPVDPARVLVIGDAARTDLAGAKLMGFDALFIAGGIHRDEIMQGDAVDEASMSRVLARHEVSAVAAMAALV